MLKSYTNYSLPAFQGIRTRCICTCLVLLFCAGPQVAAAKETDPDETTVEPSVLFYPPLPNPPRIQYLKTFSSSKDMQTKKKESSFFKFILGDEVDEDEQVVNKPYGVALSKGRIYLVDTRGSGYAVFDLPDKSFDFVLGSGEGGMEKPINITIDTDGTKYITDTNRKQILIYNKDDKFSKALGIEGQFKPVDVAIDGNRLFVSDIEHHQIQVLDKASGGLISTISEVGSAEGQLFHPTNIAIGPDHHLYVSDTGNFRIQVFTLEGEYVRTIGGQGLGPGQLARPKGIALDHEGNLYVVDAAFENVQIFNPQGELLMFFGGPGANHPSGMTLPTDIVINYESVAYFQQYADPKFQLEYVILIPNQFGRSKVNVFGYGRMEGMSYPQDE
jgi:sugar lactone lactonase YvrE